MDYDEPHMAPNEKMHPIQWIERPTGALVAAGSLCLKGTKYQHGYHSEPASMTATVGHSIHRMGCVFHLPLHPTLTNILPQSVLFT
jgi:hypothetical protein